jgi:hypothetical protein
VSLLEVRLSIIALSIICGSVSASLLLFQEKALKLYVYTTSCLLGGWGFYTLLKKEKCEFRLYGALAGVGTGLAVSVCVIPLALFALSAAAGSFGARLLLDAGGFGTIGGGSLVQGRTLLHWGVVAASGLAVGLVTRRYYEKSVRTVSVFLGTFGAVVTVQQLAGVFDTGWPLYLTFGIGLGVSFLLLLARYLLFQQRRSPPPQQ